MAGKRDNRQLETEHHRTEDNKCISLKQLTQSLTVLLSLVQGFEICKKNCVQSSSLDLTSFVLGSSIKILLHLTRQLCHIPGYETWIFT